MIESILLVALGFFGASLLALMVMPLLWRRAALLARRRVEASIPLTKAEILADKDRLRADFAMDARRLEMKIKTLGEKAAVQALELDRQRDMVRELTASGGNSEERIAALAAELATRESELAAAREEMGKLAGRVTEIEAIAEERGRELEEMSGLYEDASYASSTRQIELVSREAEIDRLSDEVSGLRTQRKEAERRVREAEGTRKAGEEALAAERKRAADLDSQVSRLMTSISDLEERLERREKEIARLDKQEKEVVRLQRDLLTEKKRADGLAGKAAAMAPLINGHAHAEDAVLREQINEMAAQVVQLTALLEAPDSPLREQLANGKVSAAVNGDMPVTSIADRVRALQKAAASRAN